MKTINKLRVRNLNGTFDQEIPFGVESSAMTRPSGESVEDALKRADSTASKASTNENNIKSLNEANVSLTTQIENANQQVNNVMMDSSSFQSTLTIREVEIISQREELDIQFFANRMAGQLFIQGTLSSTFSSAESGSTICNLGGRSPYTDFQKIVPVNSTKCAVLRIDTLGSVLLGPIYNMSTGAEVDLATDETIHISETFLVNPA